MNEYQKIKSLSEKIERLLGTIGNNSGRFSSIDKDLLTNYVRELYELIVSIRTQHSVPIESQKSSPYSNGDEIKLTAGLITEREEKPEQKLITNGEEINGSKESPAKKSISEIYAGRKENGKGTVNDKFKKQGLEIADKLKQTPIKDLKSYIGLNKQFAFMSKLFNADEQLYDEVIARLNSFSSYEEASSYIQSDLLPLLNWSDNEPLVGEFFTLVMRRYLN